MSKRLSGVLVRRGLCNLDYGATVSRRGTFNRINI